MVISEEIRYVKKFYSIKSEVNPHNNNFRQMTCKKDNSLRREIQEKFDVKGTNGMGYDGRQFYKWTAGDNLGPRINEEERIKYNLIYSIQKSGRLEDLSKNCDLEDFLENRGFERIIEPVVH